MSGHYRLRLTPDSALRLAEWQLQQERRRALKWRQEPYAPPPKKRSGPGFLRLSLFWFTVGVLVWLAIELSRLKLVDQKIEIAIGILWVVLVTSAFIVWFAALTFWRSRTR